MAKSKAEIICPNVDKQKVEETRQLAEKIATLPMQTKLVFAAAAEMAAIIHDAKGAYTCTEKYLCSSARRGTKQPTCWMISCGGCPRRFLSL